MHTSQWGDTGAVFVLLFPSLVYWHYQTRTLLREMWRTIYGSLFAYYILYAICIRWTNRREGVFDPPQPSWLLLLLQLNCTIVVGVLFTYIFIIYYNVSAHRHHCNARFSTDQYYIWYNKLLFSKTCEPTLFHIVHYSVAHSVERFKGCLNQNSVCEFLTWLC